MCKWLTWLMNYGCGAPLWYCKCISNREREDCSVWVKPLYISTGTFIWQSNMGPFLLVSTYEIIIHCLVSNVPMNYVWSIGKNILHTQHRSFIHSRPPSQPLPCDCRCKPPLPLQRQHLERLESLFAAMSLVSLFRQRKHRFANSKEEPFWPRLSAAAARFEGS